MKKLTLLIMICLCCVATGSELTNQFEEANHAYQSGNFQKAVLEYEEILKQGYESAELYYNLGNSYYKLNNVPAAILQYERALRAAPWDEDIAHNLSLANLRVSDKIELVPELFFIRWWNGFTGLSSADGWARTGIVSFWISLACASFLFVLRRMSIRRLMAVAAVGALFASLISFTCMIHRIQIRKNSDFAVIFSPTVYAKSAPDEKSTDLFVIHEGVKVQVLDGISDWKKIRLADGKVGWIPAQTFKLI